MPNGMSYAIMNGMNLKLDSAGRIVLPKAVRDRFRLTAGSVLKLEENPGELVLRPAEHSPSMVQRDGFWVYVGEVPAGFNWDTMVEDAREERDREVLGL